MAKKKEEFVPRQIDEYAVEIEPGVVRIADVDGTIPLEEYLQNKEKELSSLRVQEAQLYTRVKEHIKRYLVVRTGTWQEDCRRLSWAYTANGEFQQLKQMVEVCPSMKLGMPVDSEVTMHHLSHLIRAFLATTKGLEQVTAGHGACIVYNSSTQEEALQNRLVVWKFLLSRLSEEEREKCVVKRTTAMERVLQELAEIKALLLEMKSKRGK